VRFPNGAEANGLRQTSKLSRHRFGGILSVIANLSTVIDRVPLVSVPKAGKVQELLKIQRTNSGKKIGF